MRMVHARRAQQPRVGGRVLSGIGAAACSRSRNWIRAVSASAPWATRAPDLESCFLPFVALLDPLKRTCCLRFPAENRGARPYHYLLTVAGQHGIWQPGDALREYDEK